MLLLRGLAHKMIELIYEGTNKLHCACPNRTVGSDLFELHLVQLLLRYGADVNAKGGYHGIAFEAARDVGSKAVVKLRISHGAIAK